MGEATPEATRLIHVACQAACGKREKVAIYGTDSRPPDGTCVRDYIHVEDLATAHLLALAYLLEGAQRKFLRPCAREARLISNLFQQDGGMEILPALVANTEIIRKLFPWKPIHQDLETICTSALLWEKTHPVTRQPNEKTA